MKKGIFIVWILCFVCQIHAQIIGNLQQLGGTSTERIHSMDIDNYGNIYSIGIFGIGTDFDPGLDSLFISTSFNIKFFIKKQDREGNLIWVKDIGIDNGINNHLMGPSRLALDSEGNLLILLEINYSTLVDIDPGPDSTIINGNQGRMVFLKLDPQGNLLWMKQFQNQQSGILYHFNLKFDKSDNIYISSSFTGTINLGTGGINNYMSSLSYSTYDFFVAKYSPQGNFLWAKEMNAPIDSDLLAIGGIEVDEFSNVYLAGQSDLYPNDSIDFDPGIGTHFEDSSAAFLIKLDSTGNFLWVKFIKNWLVEPTDIKCDDNGNLIIIGSFKDSTDFDPGQGIHIVPGNFPNLYHFVLKLTSNGSFIWVKTFSGSGIGKEPIHLDIDKNNEIYVTGIVEGQFDLDPGPSVVNTYYNIYNKVMYIVKLSSSGNYIWSYQGVGDFRIPSPAASKDILKINPFNEVIRQGVGGVNSGQGFLTFSPLTGNYQMQTQNADVYYLRLFQGGISGTVFEDNNLNCQFDNGETVFGGRNVIIQPGNIITQTNLQGIWYVDSLPAGNYTATVDTTGGWVSNCSITQSFTVLHPDSIAVGPSFGLVSSISCSEPDISIHAPFLRPGFSNQRVNVQACNLATASSILDSAYVIVELDSLLTVDTASLPYLSLGNNKYRVEIGSLLAQQCKNFYFECTLDQNAILGQTLCMQAELLPVDSCALDTVAQPFPTTVSPCNTPWDKSSLQVEGECLGDTVQFTIYNTGDPGDGDMTCFAPVRLYIDGQFIIMDSIQLNGGDSVVFNFAGDGRTWRLEADQHPLHPGNSNPNATVELCGDPQNWSPGFFNVLPQDDADPVIDIYCGQVTGSYDPNDKTGFPLGRDSAHYILQNQDLEYLIRFQNTGTDTAFTVVIRDTLPAELDIFSVRSGAASHDYNFRMYGPRILEWTFNDILLPDSTTNEPESHGFVKFKVKQNRNLPIGTVINNNAGIYFDFNEPIITNVYHHSIDSPQTLNYQGTDTLTGTYCDNEPINGLTYGQSGQYYQQIANGDSLLVLNLTIQNTSRTYFSPAVCDSFSLNGQTYNVSGNYEQYFTNAIGCDSIVHIDLDILRDSVELQANACDDYTLNGQTYTASGVYSQTLSNAAGCDSTITLNLNIDNSSAIDGTLSWDGSSIRVGEANASYQWIDCDNGGQPVAGATQQSFSPGSNGNYAVEVTQGACTITSNCINITIVGVQTNPQRTIRIYPNPAKDQLTVELGEIQHAHILLLDLQGRLLQQNQNAANKVQLSLRDLPAGLYFLQVTHQNEQQNFKVIKQ